MWATASVDELKAMADPIGSGIVVVGVDADASFRYLCVNRRIENIAGVEHGAISGKRVEEVFSGERAAVILARYRRCVETGATLDYEEGLTLAGRSIWFKAALSPVTDPAGRVVRLVISVVDITDRRQLECELRRAAQELRASENRLQVAVRGAELGIWEWDIAAGRLRVADDWAPSLRLYDGFEDIPLGQWLQTVHPRDRAVAVGAGDSISAGEASSYTVDYRVRNRRGQWQWLQVHGSVVERDESGAPRMVSGIYRDIGPQKLQEEELRKLSAELEYRAVHDSLTDVLNHGAILEVLHHELARAQREGGAVTLALIDADRFKAINDTYGHQTGDEVLKGLVQRIRAVLRPYDHLGRYGGEEFLVVAPGGSAVMGLHERIRMAVSEKPFATAAGDLFVTVSIGVAVSVYAQGRAGLSAEQLILAADNALYRAKDAGRNRVVYAAS